MTLTVWITILAPLAALAIKLATAGWLVVFMLFWSPVLLGGYVLLVVAAARGMLRPQGVLREAARRTRATAWAWLTSVGVLLLACTIIDGGDSRESVHSLLTLAVGATSPSAAHDISGAIGWVAALAWLVGWVALMVEWAVGVQRHRPQRRRVSPPTGVPPSA